MRVTKVYTRGGDQGMTRLVGNHEIEKSSQRIEALGAVDELNAVTGFARSLFEAGQAHLDSVLLGRTLTELLAIQNMLAILGGELASLVSGRWPDMPVITAAHVQEIEQRLDAMNKDLPPLKEFILPGGSPPSAALHLARTICRRAEREVVRLSQIESIGEFVIPFLNRLSDYFFVLTRWTCLQTGAPEVYWKRMNQAGG